MLLEGQTLRREQVSEPKWRVAPGGKEVSCYIQQHERERERGVCSRHDCGLGWWEMRQREPGPFSPVHRERGRLSAPGEGIAAEQEDSGAWASLRAGQGLLRGSTLWARGCTSRPEGPPR